MPPLRDLIEAADDALGDRLERAFVAHHRRRLGRLGWDRVLDAPAGGWADGEPAPRAGNAVEVLVDGAEALPRLVEEIERAESHVHLAGWYFSPDFELDRRGRTLRQLLAETAERVDVRVLAWAGAPLPLFRPDRGEVRAMREALTGGTRIRCALDDRERPMHCHHEKLALIDDHIAFVGGIDLTTLDGDRFDSSDHAARGARGWHDVATRLRGPVVADVAAHFRLRWEETTGEGLPAAAPPGGEGDIEAQLVRTVPERVYRRLPRGDFRILESYVRALRSAERFAYLESQFLWSPELVSILVDKLRRPPSDEFRIVVVLPAKPDSGEDDTRGQVGVLVDADDGAGRFLACTLYQRGSPAQGIYVHAKVGIVDDHWLAIGSANLNDHSFFNDTEVCVVVRDDRLARATRLRLWSEHLETPAGELDGDVAAIVDERWRPRAEEQLARLSAGLPPTHRLARLPNVSRRSRGLMGPLNGLLVDG
jgi:phosphatidylserine/phosphatidylglycerophosphate/cardiolipin synthase-like enzyme